jgi:hypothetical protein
MSTNLVRMRYAGIAAKIETTVGTDSIAGTPVAADFFRGDVTVNFGQTTVPDPSLTGSLDNMTPIVGGLRPTITIRVPLRGSGAAATAPEWGKLLRCCTYIETATGAAVGAPTALPASGHTTTEVTVATPFAATAQLYRGMPLILSGAVPALTGIWDYTVGRVARIVSTLPSVPAATTSAQIPINNLYSPTSDESAYRTATLYFYADGLRWRFVGGVGTFSLTMTTGGTAELVFTMRAQFLDTSATTLPTGWNGTNPVPVPRWVGGLSQIGNATAAVRTMSFDAGVGIVLPDNPEAAEGVDPGVPIERAATGRMDPYMNTTNYVSLFNNFRAGTTMPIAAIIGSTAGNRFLIMTPQARVLQNDPGNREGLGANSITFQADGADSGLFICAF